MKKISVLLVLCLIAFSCSKEESVINETNAESNSNSEQELVLLEGNEQDRKSIPVPIPPPTFGSITYKGNVYAFNFDEGILDKALLSDDVIKAMTTSHVVKIGGNNEIYLFDEEIEVDQFLESYEPLVKPIKGSNTIMEKAGASRVYMFQHSHFRGDFRYGNNVFSVSELRNHGFHDRISSIIVVNNTNYNHVARYYEHANYGGRIFITRTPPNSCSYIWNLSGFFNFNDIISSVRTWH